MIDSNLRDLDRAARRDPSDRAAYRDARIRTGCRLNVHDYRNDRLCAWCDRQEPGLRLWDALKASDGNGVVGFTRGRLIGSATGTYKGLPRRSRSQEGLRISMHCLNVSGLDRRKRVLHRLPLHPEHWPGGRADAAHRLYRSRWPAKAPIMRLASLLVWFPVNQSVCRAEGYSDGGLWFGDSLYEGTKLTEPQIEINRMIVAEQAAAKADALERARWRWLDAATDPTCRVPLTSEGRRLAQQALGAEGD